MKYEVKINEFEGPLDLLLHLIKKDNINIYDINLEMITNQYLEYITHMKNLNLDVASEYLVMAAELIEMKSNALLPKRESENIDEFEEDPKEALIRKLIEYQRYKDVTSELKDLENTRGEIYTKLPESMSLYTDKKILTNDYNLTVDDLMNAFDQFLSRKKLEQPLSTTVTKKEFSLKDRTESIRNILRKKEKVSFDELFEIRTKDFVVITFLSILEMAKKQEIIITQEDNFKNIYISLVGGN